MAPAAIEGAAPGAGSADLEVLGGPGPDAPLMTCARCGVFLRVPAEVRPVSGRSYCRACAAHPEVDHLAAYRLRCEGRRDLWAWFLGLSALGSLSQALQLVGQRHLELAAGQLVLAAMQVGFFLGQRWSRWGLLGAQVLGLLVGIPTATTPAAGGQLLGRTVGGLLMWGIVIASTRNRLFFRLEVSREDLEKAWALYHHNLAARAGFALGLVSLVLWPAAVVALPLSIRGLRRVDPTATPPIGRRGQAIAGIVLSSLGLLALVVAAAVWGASRA